MVQRACFLGGVLTVLALAVAGAPANAQRVEVGKGSYAAAVPEGADHTLREFESKPIYTLPGEKRALPTNKWWTQLLVDKFAKSLWSIPLRVETSARGADVCFPIRWNDSGSDPVCDYPITLAGKEFTAESAVATNWSDWHVSFRMTDKSQGSIDYTLAEGMPSVWAEYHGVEPLVKIPANLADPSDCRLFGLTGAALTLPATSDTLGFTLRGRTFALFAPDGTRFQKTEGGISAQFTDASHGYLILCALPAPADITRFHRHSFAIPRHTEISWKWEPERGRVETVWTVTTEALKGSEKRVIQGWIPHHYRGTTADFAFDGPQYLSPRGPLKTAVGTQFRIAFPYSGILPNLPAPNNTAFQKARMEEYLRRIAAKPHFADDTYWGGKDLLRFGQCTVMSAETAAELKAGFVKELHTALSNWLTYAPGKKSHYFAYYSKWKALVGVNPSYGSEAFNDHHFHYGYFTYAAALLAASDPTFLADYGEMIRLVAKEYANYDRKDARLPFLRTFDIWAGHSWAGGTSSPGGENQESSSEAVQSWAGLIYLGEALGDSAMRDAGIAGYAMETASVLEYWFNRGGDVFPPLWKHPVTGMVWSGGKVYGTYFTGDPAWIYAIQWLPASPMLSFLARDKQAAARDWNNMVSDYEKHEIAEAAKPENIAKGYKAKKATIESFGPALGSVMIGYRLMFDPVWAIEQMDTLWKTPGDEIAHNADEMAIMYYLANATASLGDPDWSVSASRASAMAYKNSKGVEKFVVWNPSTSAVKVTFYRNGALLGTLMTKPGGLTATAKLNP